MGLESGQVHVEIKHSIDKLGDLTSGQVREALNEKIGDVLAKECRICLAGRSCGCIKQGHRHLIHLNQMEHMTQQCGVHLES